MIVSPHSRGVVGDGEVHAVAQVLAEPLRREGQEPAVVGEDDVLFGEAGFGQDVGEIEVGLAGAVPQEHRAVALHHPVGREAHVVPEPVVARLGGELPGAVVLPPVERAAHGVADDLAAVADVRAEVRAVPRLAVQLILPVPPQHQVALEDLERDDPVALHVAGPADRPPRPGIGGVERLVLDLGPRRVAGGPCRSIGVLSRSPTSSSLVVTGRSPRSRPQLRARYRDQRREQTGRPWWPPALSPPCRSRERR